MSRFYEMAVEIKGYDPTKSSKIMDNTIEVWNFDFDEIENVLYGRGQDFLYGGDTEEDFSKRLAKIIFETNGTPCEVTVYATYLDDLPSDSYHYSSLEDIQ